MWCTTHGVGPGVGSTQGWKDVGVWLEAYDAMLRLLMTSLNIGRCFVEIYVFWQAQRKDRYRLVYVLSCQYIWQ